MLFFSAANNKVQKIMTLNVNVYIPSDDLQGVPPFQVKGFTFVLIELQKIPTNKVNESSTKTVTDKYQYTFSFFCSKFLLMLSTVTVFIINFNFNFLIFQNKKKYFKMKIKHLLFQNCI